MSNYARLRVLLAMSVLMIGGSVWLIAGVQRKAVIGMQGQLRVSSDLLTAMLDQETGLRGYALTGDKAFLRPYELGKDDFRRALQEARAAFGREHVTAGLLSGLESTARRWQAYGRSAVAQVDHRGPRAIDLGNARKRKVLMDDFRKQDAALREHVEQRAQAELQRARWVAFGFVVIFGAIVLSFGMLVVERQSRRDRAQDDQRREYVDALQGVDGVHEARELLRRRAERLGSARACRSARA